MLLYIIIVNKEYPTKASIYKNFDDNNIIYESYDSAKKECDNLNDKYGCNYARVYLL